MKVLVCGGRNYTNIIELYACLNALAEVVKIDLIIEGEASGADRLARHWAFERNIPVQAYPADWARLGQGAGPVRNEEMLVKGQPDLVLAFPSPGSKGTWDMVGRARKAGVKTLVMPADRDLIDALGEGVFV